MPQNSILIIKGHITLNSKHYIIDVPVVFGGSAKVTGIRNRTGQSTGCLDRGELEPETLKQGSGLGFRVLGFTVYLGFRVYKGFRGEGIIATLAGRWPPAVSSMDALTREACIIRDLQS